MQVIARDMTGRRIAEDHLRQSEEQFRLVAENGADMIEVLDLDGKRIYNSPAYRGILGDPEALRGTDGFQEIHPEDVAGVKRVFQETISTGAGHRLEYRLLLKDGSVRNIDSKASVIKDRDGGFSRVIVVSGLTARRQVQATEAAATVSSVRSFPPAGGRNRRRLRARSRRTGPPDIPPVAGRRRVLPHTPPAGCRR